MKEILLLSLFVAVAACGYFEGSRGPAGKDGKSPEAEEAKDGVDGDDAVVSSLHCDYKLVYPHDKNPYIVHYSEVAFSEGTVLASFAMTYSGTGQQLFREAMLFAKGEPVVIIGQNWIASKKELVHKASGTKYAPKCK